MQRHPLTNQLQTQWELALEIYTSNPQVGKLSSYKQKNPITYTANGKMITLEYPFVFVENDKKEVIQIVLEKKEQGAEKLEGTYGKVRIGRDKNGNQVAVKFSKKEPFEFDETYITKKLSLFIGNADKASYNKNNRNTRSILAMKYLGQSLTNHIENKNKNNETIDIGHLIRGTVQAIKNFHTQNILHRDIKPDNLMIDENGKIHLVDFASSIILSQRHEIINDQRLFGTRGYAPPEVIIGKISNYSIWSDYFSLGKTILELNKHESDFYKKEIIEKIAKLMCCETHNERLSLEIFEVAHIVLMNITERDDSLIDDLTKTNCMLTDTQLAKNIYQFLMSDNVGAICKFNVRYNKLSKIFAQNSIDNDLLSRRFKCEVQLMSK